MSGERSALGAVFQRLVAAALMLPALTSAGRAGDPDKDKAWDAQVENAKAHGGVETVLDQSASYVFQRPDGSYVSFTRLLARPKRSVCLIAKDLHVTVCVDWDTGKTSYGERADAATPWKVHEGPSPEEVAAHQQSLLDRLLSMFALPGAKQHAGYSTTPNGGSARVSPK